MLKSLLNAFIMLYVWEQFF